MSSPQIQRQFSIHVPKTESPGNGVNCERKPRFCRIRSGYGAVNQAGIPEDDISPFHWWNNLPCLKPLTINRNDLPMIAGGLNRFLGEEVPKVLRSRYDKETSRIRCNVLQRYPCRG